MLTIPINYIIIISIAMLTYLQRVVTPPPRTWDARSSRSPRAAPASRGFHLRSSENLPAMAVLHGEVVFTGKIHHKNGI